MIILVELVIENFKKIKALAIKPDRSVVNITGKNGAGKSCVLDAFIALVGGKDAEPDEPIRRGEKLARVMGVLGDRYRVEKVWEQGKKSKLKLTSVDGKRSYDKDRPQSLLNDLFPGIGFNPMAFDGMTPTEQADTLRELLGLDFGILDAEYDERFTIRTGVNGRIRDLDGQLKAMPTVKAPDKEESLTKLADEIAEVGVKNAARVQLIADEDKAKSTHVAAGDRLAAAEQELDDARAALMATAEVADDLHAKVMLTRPVDVEPLRAKMREAEATNVLVRRKKAKAQKQEEIWKLEAEANKLTERLDAIKAEKRQQIAACPMPVEGLDFDDDGLITIDGFLYKQCASSQRIRTSAAIGIKMNPGGVMCVYDASMLDTAHLAMFEKMMEEQLEGGCVFIERATDGKEETGFVIEEGELKE